MSFRKMFVRITGIGTLFTAALLGQERPGSHENSTDISQLKGALAAQQKQLQQQHQEIQDLKSMLQKQAADQASRTPPPNTKIARSQAPAPNAAASQSPASRPTSSAASAAGPTEPVVTTPVPTVVPEFDPDQEYETEKPEEAGIEIGPAQFRPGGYIALTGFWRSSTATGGTGTPFARVPFPSQVLGQVPEARLSAQATRLSLRVDVPFPEGRFRRVSGYIETDFNGVTPGSVALTSTSVGFRLRHAFVEAQYGDHWFFVIGQAFSLMTPAKDQLSIWPADYETPQVVDTSYVAGFVYARLPQVRITWRPKKSFNWAFSVENPEQQVGSGGIVTFPTCCTSDLTNQYNTGSDEFKTPNLIPDFHTRVAFNSERFHIDIGGVLRTFHHTITPLHLCLDIHPDWWRRQREHERKSN